MKQRSMRALCLLLLLCLSCLFFGCGNAEDAPKHETVMLNSVDRFFSNGTYLEANVRELVYDGNDASVRIRLTNIGDDPIDGADANVRFLDQDGNVLFEEEMRATFEKTLYKDETVSVTISCSGRDVSKICTVSVTDFAE